MLIKVTFGGTKKPQKSIKRMEKEGMTMRIGIFYFSATGITRAYAHHMCEELSQEKEDTIHVTNILSFENRSLNVDFGEYDACIFGFPVYKGRLPIVVEEWLRSVEGAQIPCSMFFTYGGRDLEYANHITYYLLTKNNFTVLLSAEFVGAHSFNVAKGWSMAGDRPNEGDYKVATRFAKKSRELFSCPERFSIDLTHFEYHPEKKEGINGPFSIFLPSKRRKSCQLCYRCEKECPTHAFDVANGADPQKCILCMHCVTICPDHVIEVGDGTELFKFFMDYCNLTEDSIKQKKSRIYPHYLPKE
jgi:ferredoxin